MCARHGVLGGQPSRGAVLHDKHPHLDRSGKIRRGPAEDAEIVNRESTRVRSDNTIDACVGHPEGRAGRNRPKTAMAAQHEALGWCHRKMP